MKNSLLISTSDQLTLRSFLKLPSKECKRHLKAYKSSAYHEKRYSSDTLNKPLRSFVHLSLFALLYLPIVKQISYLFLRTAASIAQKVSPSPLQTKTVEPLVLENKSADKAKKKLKARHRQEIAKLSHENQVLTAQVRSLEQPPRNSFDFLVRKNPSDFINPTVPNQTIVQNAAIPNLQQQILSLARDPQRKKNKQKNLHDELGIRITDPAWYQQAQIDRLNSELQEREHNNTNLQQQLQAQGAILAQANQNLDEQQTQVLQLNQRIQDRALHCQDLEQQIQLQEIALAQNVREMQALQQRLEDTERASVAKNADINRTNQALVQEQQNVQNLQQQLQDHACQNTAFQQDLQAKNNELAQERTLIQQLRGQAAEKEISFTALQTESLQKDQELAREQERAKQLELRVQQQTEALTEDQELLKELEQKLQQTELDSQTQREKANQLLAQEQERARQLELRVQQQTEALTKDQELLKELEQKLQQTELDSQTQREKANQLLTKEQERARQLELRVQQQTEALTKDQELLKELEQKLQQTELDSQAKLEKTSQELAQEQERARQLELRVQQQSEDLTKDQELLKELEQKLQQTELDSQAKLEKTSQELVQEQERTKQLELRVQQQSEALTKDQELLKELEQKLKQTELDSQTQREKANQLLIQEQERARQLELRVQQQTEALTKDQELLKELEQKLQQTELDSQAKLEKTSQELVQEQERAKQLELRVQQQSEDLTKEQEQRENLQLKLQESERDSQDKDSRLDQASQEIAKVQKRTQELGLQGAQQQQKLDAAIQELQTTKSSHEAREAELLARVERLENEARLADSAMKRALDQQQLQFYAQLQGIKPEVAEQWNAKTSYFSKENVLQKNSQDHFEKYLCDQGYNEAQLEDIDSLMQKGAALERALSHHTLVENELSVFKDSNSKIAMLQGYLLLQHKQRNAWQLPDLNHLQAKAFFAFAKSCYPESHPALYVLPLADVSYCKGLQLELSLNNVCLTTSDSRSSIDTGTLLQDFDELFRNLEGKSSRGFIGTVKNSNLVTKLKETNSCAFTIFNYLEHFFFDPSPRLQNFHWARVSLFLNKHEPHFQGMEGFGFFKALASYKKSSEESLNLAKLEDLLLAFAKHELNMPLHSAFALLGGNKMGEESFSSVQLTIDGRTETFSKDRIKKALLNHYKEEDIDSHVYPRILQLLQGLPHLALDASRRTWDLGSHGIEVKELKDKKPILSIAISGKEITFSAQGPYQLGASYPDSCIAFEEKKPCVYASIHANLEITTSVDQLLQQKPSHTYFQAKLCKQEFPASRSTATTEPSETNCSRILFEDEIQKLNLNSGDKTEFIDTVQKKFLSDSQGFIHLETPPYLPIEVTPRVKAFDVYDYLADVYRNGLDVLIAIEKSLDLRHIFLSGPSLAELKRKFQNFNPEKALAKIPSPLSFETKMAYADPKIKQFVNEAKNLGFVLENEVYQEIQAFLKDEFQKMTLTPDDKLYIQQEIVNQLGVIYSKEFFKKVLAEEKWQKIYQNEIDFGESKAKVYLAAVPGHYMSSGEPRRRNYKENTFLKVPNFFEHTYSPLGNLFSNKTKCIETRSATIVEFDQKDPDQKRLVNRELARQVLVHHAKRYIEENQLEKSDKPIKIDFAELRFLTPDHARDLAHHWGCVHNCDNEAMLYRETLEAFEYFQAHPEMTVDANGKSYQVEFDIMVLNASCNRARDDLAKNETIANWITHNLLETQKNRESLSKLKKKIELYENQCKLKGYEMLLDGKSDDGWVEGVEKACPDIEKRNQIFKIKLMQDLLAEIEEMMGINDAKKTEAFAYNYYSLPARMRLLLFLLNINTNEGCRSAKDRTGLAVLEYMLLLQLCFEKKRLVRYIEIESTQEGSWSDKETCKKHADQYRATLFEQSFNIDIIPLLNLGWNLGMNLAGAGNPEKHGEVSKNMTAAAYAAASVYHRPNSGPACYTPIVLWQPERPSSPTFWQSFVPGIPFFGARH